MSLIVLLDSGPLGLATNPKSSPEADACKLWLRGLPRAGHLALAPEITDYELRRELRLYNKVRGLQNLDTFKTLNRCSSRRAGRHSPPRGLEQSGRPRSHSNDKRGAFITLRGGAALAGHTCVIIPTAILSMAILGFAFLWRDRTSLSDRIGYTAGKAYAQGIGEKRFERKQTDIGRAAGRHCGRGRR